MKVTRLFKLGEEDTKSVNHRFYYNVGNTQNYFTYLLRIVAFIYI